jgi:hypothetical protein
LLFDGLLAVAFWHGRYSRAQRHRRIPSDHGKRHMRIMMLRASREIRHTVMTQL